MKLRLEQSTAPVKLELEHVRAWILWLTEVERCLGPYFSRRDVRQRARASLRGLLSPAERKNSWQVAEVNGDATPYGVQHLLGRAVWDAEAVRDAVLPYVIEPLGAPDSVLVIDETGFLKKGRQSAGVARQYSGTAGRVENCPIGVFLAYASAHGYALLDRALSLPKEWTQDRERCDRTGSPRAQPFATKPELARQMLERALRAGVPATWGTGASVQGDDRRLRMWLEAQDQAYVLAVLGKEQVWLDWHQRQVKTGLAALPAEGWPRCSAGEGTKGPRLYDWYWLPLAGPLQPERRRWLVVRRSVSDSAERTAFVVFAPQTTTLEEVLPVAGRRWTIESSFEAAKGAVGLDHYEGRSGTGGYRHITLAMWALALLAVLRAAPLPVAPAPPKRGARPTPSSLARFKTSRGLLSP